MFIVLKDFLKFSETIINNTLLIPTLLGDTGAGKTSAVIQYYQERGYTVLKFVAKDISESIAIMPSVTTNMIEVWMLSSLKTAFESGKPVLVILDEVQTLDRAPDPVIVIIRQLMIERNISGYTVPSTVKFIILGNEAKDTKTQREIRDYIPGMLLDVMLLHTLEYMNMNQWIASLPKDWEHHSKEFLSCLTTDVYHVCSIRFMTQVSNLLDKDLDTAYHVLVERCGTNIAKAFIANVIQYRARKPKVLNTAYEVYQQVITDGGAHNISADSLKLLLENDIHNLNMLGITLGDT